MILLIYILTVWGLSNAISNEYVFEWLRVKVSKISIIRNLLGCSTCTGFWTGVLLFFLMNPLQATGIVLFDAVIGGLICSGVNNILEHIKIRFGN